jgi:hypothetical protein
MKDREPRRGRTIKEKGEQERPLTVTLSETTRRRILSGVKPLLKQYTRTELIQRDKPIDPNLLGEIEEVRHPGANTSWPYSCQSKRPKRRPAKITHPEKSVDGRGVI